jgi:uncharacterized protein (TIGR00369 family)
MFYRFSGGYFRIYGTRGRARTGQNSISPDSVAADVKTAGGARHARSPVGLTAIRKRIEEGWTPPIAKLLGFSLTKIGRGWAWIEIDVDPRHANPMGTLHGGVICDIADAAMGMSYVSLLGAHESFTTIEIKANFLRPVWSGHLVAKGKILRKGRTLGLAECRVLDEQKRLVAYATCTCMTVPCVPGRELTRAMHERAPSRH